MDEGPKVRVKGLDWEAVDAVQVSMGTQASSILAQSWLVVWKDRVGSAWYPAATELQEGAVCLQGLTGFANLHPSHVEAMLSITEGVT